MITYLPKTEMSKATKETTSFCFEGLSFVLTFGFWYISSEVFDRDIHIQFTTLPVSNYQVFA